jgi:hypothetical protein
MFLLFGKREAFATPRRSLAVFSGTKRSGRNLARPKHTTKIPFINSTGWYLLQVRSSAGVQSRRDLQNPHSKALT